MDKKQYVLRRAAGVYWLLDINQLGVPYKPPLRMNEMGAEIWRMLEQGNNRNQIVNLMSMEYDADIELVEQDVNEFLLQLEQYGVGKVQ
ncbi:MAG: PqqD family protein [Eubacteriales bacterium]|nr:PqqD family protein [Eubacteriales bacterium]